MSQRSIEQEIWRDPTFSTLSSEAKLLSIYCLTNPNLKLIPAFKLTEREIIFDLGFQTKKLQLLIKEIETIGIFFLDNYCVIKSDFYPNLFKGEKLKKAIDKQINKIPENIIQIMNSDRVSIPYRYSIDTLNINNNINNNSNILLSSLVNNKFSNIYQPEEEKKHVENKQKEKIDSTGFNSFIDKFNALTGRTFRYSNLKAKTQFMARIKEGFTLDDFETAINGVLKDNFHQESNFKYLTPEFITRVDKLERFLAQNTKAVKVEPRKKTSAEIEAEIIAMGQKK